MALEPLGTMKADRYAELARDQKKLLRYNIDMPELDYEHPYVHQEYPRVLFRTKMIAATKDAPARVQLDSAEVRNEIDEAALLKTGWALNPQQCDPPVETARAAPEIPITDMGTTMFELPAEIIKPVPVLEQAAKELAAATPVKDPIFSQDVPTPSKAELKALEEAAEEVVPRPPRVVKKKKRKQVRRASTRPPAGSQSTPT